MLSRDQANKTTDPERQDNGHSWRGNNQLKIALENAGCRYAILVGVVDPDAGLWIHPVRERLSRSMLADDAKKYAHLVKKSARGGRVWIHEDAVVFVSEVAGVTETVATEWLEFDWSWPLEVDDLEGLADPQ